MKPLGKLFGKRVLVTAGAQGIGFAISQAMIAAGCDVYVHYRSSKIGAENLARDASAAGRRFGSSSADLSEPAEANRVVEAAIHELGGLDILVNNAGGLVARRTFADTDPQFWQEVIKLNISSAVAVSHAALPSLTAAAATRGGASVINVSSIAGRKGGGPGSIAYATAKGALLTFTRSLATEMGPKGIRVNALAPGLILGTQFHAKHTSPDAAQQMITGIPIGRAGVADDVARAVVFLASEFDGFITGATLDINGGMYCS